MPTSRTAVDPASDIVLVKSLVLPQSVPAAFRLFTDAMQLQSWLCEMATVEARLGGRYELFWEPSDPESDSTIGCRITAFEDGQLLAFQWRSPKQFKPFANAADPLTHVVVTFHKTTEGVKVTLVHSGWRSTPEWLEAAQWQSVAWDYAFQALKAHAQGAAQ